MEDERLADDSQTHQPAGIAPSRPGALPAQPDPLIGRQESVDLVCATLLRPECRLLTLLGIGGIGKTRLAVAAAVAVATRFRDGVSFVDLARVTEADAVPREVARALDLRLDGRDPLGLVQDFLRDRELLLVLDNVEHVRPAALVDQLLARCAGLTILATSREPLRLQWEQRFFVPPLAIPDPDLRGSAEELRVNPSVALFIQRARALDLRFEETEASVRQIASICVRLEGVPLAIELAAARTNLLSPSAILECIEAHPLSLRRQMADVPDRHRSLEAMLDWSYGLLSPRDQAVFRRLGVFVGGFTLEAAHAVAGTDTETVEILDVLSSLADKGLIVPVPSGDGATRCRLLETVRGYAREQLQAAGEADHAAAAHAAYYLVLAEQAAASLRYGGFLVFASDRAQTAGSARGQTPWPAVLAEEDANLEVALRWADAHDALTLLRLATALARYWWVQGALTRGEEWLERGLARCPDVDPALRSRALGGLGALYRQHGDAERARVLLEEAVALARTLDDQVLLVTQLIELGGVLRSRGDDPLEVALTDEALDRARAAGDEWGTAAALAFHGLSVQLRGEPGAAAPVLAESQARFRRLEDRRSVLIMGRSMARGLWLQGEVRGALSLIAESLDLRPDRGEDTLVPGVIELAACLLTRDGVPDACARLLGAGERLRERGYVRSGPEKATYEAALAAVRAALDEQTVARMMDEGRQLSGEAAMAEVRELVGHALERPAESVPAPNRSPSVQLSPREREVLALAVEGYTNQEIGERLQISASTAKLHVTSLLKKLGARNRSQLVRIVAQDEHLP